MSDPLPRARLLRLSTELMKEVGVVERVGSQTLRDAATLAGSRLSGADDQLRPLLAVVAVGLHRWYSAVESIVERIERVFATLPTGPEWHAELLSGAVLEIPSVRPSVLPEEHLDGLRELLRFRHFFRHAYAVELDRDKLLVLSRDLEAVSEPVLESLRQFEQFLVAAAS